VLRTPSVARSYPLGQSRLLNRSTTRPLGLRSGQNVGLVLDGPEALMRVGAGDVAWIRTCIIQFQLWVADI